MTRFTQGLLVICLLLTLLAACSEATFTTPTPIPRKPASAALDSVATPLALTLPAAESATPSLQPTAATEPPLFDLSSCPIDDTGRNICPPASVLGQLGCEWVVAPDSDLAGLEPAYPLAVCWTLGEPGLRLSPDEYVFRRGCMLPQYARYVIQRDGQVVLLGTVADFQKTFSPITSEAEALSYALAIINYQSISGFDAPPNYRYFVDRVEDSRAIQTDLGYRVNLYDYKMCGCGPHTTFAIEVLIKTDGSVEEISRAPAFEDPEQDSLCID